MAGHFFIRWVVRESIRPFGNFSPQDLQVCSYLLLESFSFAPLSKWARINAIINQLACLLLWRGFFGESEGGKQSYALRTYHWVYGPF